MSNELKLIPASSQTVGPYFRIGLQYMIDRPSATPHASGLIIRGRVLDRDGAPVPDAMLEFWSPDCGETSPSEPCSPGFRRAATDLDGGFSVAVPRPDPLKTKEGSAQAPHFLVLVFARGLLRHLMTRVYLEDEPSNASDPVLLSVPAYRRDTLIARQYERDTFGWDIILQGTNETIFFAW